MSEKLELVKSIIIKNFDIIHSEDDIDGIFNTVDYIFEQAQKRKYIPIENCPKCKFPVGIIDLHGSFRAQCDCIKVNGNTKDEALSNWMEKLND